MQENFRKYTSKITQTHQANTVENRIIQKIKKTQIQNVEEKSLNDTNSNKIDKRESPGQPTSLRPCVNRVNWLSPNQRSESPRKCSSTTITTTLLHINKCAHQSLWFFFYFLS